MENWNGKIVLDGNELKKEIKINVSAESSQIWVAVEGKVSDGDLKVKLYNPIGFRVANLNLCASKGGTAKGWMEEVMDASPGIWSLKVVNDKASGKVNIEVKQN